MKRLITAEDLLRFRFPGAPALSRNGRLAIPIKSIDGEKYRQHLWVDGRPFTQGAVSDSMPRWSPDGKTIAFARTQDERAQVWLLPADGGEPRPLTDFPAGKIKAVEWAPDGTRVVVGFRADPHPDKKPPVARHITTLRYKEDGVGFRDGAREHLWIVALDGTRRQITDGDWDDVTPAWSPDGRWIAFASNRHPEAEYHPNEWDIWLAAPDGGEPRRIPKPRGPAFAPAWSPDGTRIAWLGHDDPDSGWGVRNLHVWTGSLDGPAKDLMPDFDRTCENVTITDMKSSHGLVQRPVWSEDGKEIYFLASDSGRCHVARWNGTVELTPGDREVYAFARSGGRLVMTASDPLSIGDVCSPDGRLTDFNGPLFSELRLSTPERLDDRTWLLRPPDFDPGRRYPLILQIHGGPRGQYGSAFFHEFQLLAAQGYLVLYSNPPGSQGYGEEYARSILADWGNLDYRALMETVDRACALPFVDASRLGVCGGSYGGYMTNWIIGHTDRFKAAITMRCVSNLYSFGGTSDIGFDDRREFGAHAFEDPGKMARLSPITYVKNIRTPLLILHSEKDHRCPVEQAEQMYGFLKAMKRDVEMVRFPEESHDLSRTGRPDRRLERLRHILRWWKKYLTPL